MKLDWTYAQLNNSLLLWITARNDSNNCCLSRVILRVMNKIPCLTTQNRNQKIHHR